MTFRKKIMFLLPLLLLIPALILILKPGRPPPPPPDVIVLVTIDTLRPDHLGCYGYPRPTSPFIDRLADRGSLFLNAFSSSSHTVPAHASIFTSLHPVQHRAVTNGMGLSPTVLTAAEILKEAGYQTAAFISVNYLQELDPGFDYYDWSPGKKERHTRPAGETVNSVIEWLNEKQPSGKLFLWVHFFDPHKPYQAPPDFREAVRSKSAAEKDRFITFLTEVQGIPSDFYPAEQKLLDTFEGYDAEVAYVDSEMERLYDYLDEKGLNANALWIVTSDHGEGLGNHYFPEHSKKIYNEQLRVPLVFLFTDGRYEPARVDPLVRHVDILPTLTGLTGYPLRENVRTVQGYSLTPLFASGENPFPARYSFSQRRPRPNRGRGWEKGDVYCLQDREYKYIYHSEKEDEFFNLAGDPLENENLVDDRSASETKERFRRTLRRYYELISSEALPGDTGRIKPEYVESLRALGYL